MNYGSLKRGEVYYIHKQDVTTEGYEQDAGRPAVIVSNNIGNTHSSIVEICWLTTKPKNDLPTHVSIRSTPRTSIVLCEQITTIDTCGLGDYMCTLSDAEMAQIDIALAISLGLDLSKLEPKPAPSKPIIDTPEVSLELQKAEIERDMYKELYTNLITQFLERGAK